MLITPCSLPTVMFLSGAKQVGLIVPDKQSSITPLICSHHPPLPLTPPTSPSPNKEGFQGLNLEEEEEEEEETSSIYSDVLTDHTLTPDGHADLGLIMTEEGACCMPSEGSLSH